MPRFCPRPALVVLVLLALALNLPTARSQEAEVAPEAQKVLDAFSKYYAGLKGFRVVAKINLTVEQGDQKQSQDFKQTFAVERPNKFLQIVDSPQGGAELVTDGKQLAAFVKPSRYAIEEAPASFDELFQNPVVLGSLNFGNAGTVITSLLAEDPAKKLLTGAEKVEYGGVVELGETKCHLLKATQEQFDWELWIDAGKEPLVRQFVPDLAKVFARAAAASPDKARFDALKVSNIVTYADWEVNPEFKTDAFAFKTPENATKFDSLLEMVTGRPAVEPPHELLGKPAPVVELELLDGGKLDLASYKGKKVVILDFWATWCGPCRQAMPIIERVAAEYKEKGVELFAINIQEGADEIKEFLEEAKLALPVALDKDGEVAMAFRPNAIPQTVLVGKDGSVQVVKVGLTADLAEALSSDLAALLEGKDLAAETLAKAKQGASDDEKPSTEDDKKSEE